MLTETPELSSHKPKPECPSLLHHSPCPCLILTPTPLHDSLTDFLSGGGGGEELACLLFAAMFATCSESTGRLALASSPGREPIACVCVISAWEANSLWDVG